MIVGTTNGCGTGTVYLISKNNWQRNKIPSESRIGNVMIKDARNCQSMNAFTCLSRSSDAIGLQCSNYAHCPFNVAVDRTSISERILNSLTNRRKKGKKCY